MLRAVLASVCCEGHDGVQRAGHLANLVGGSHLHLAIESPDGHHSRAMDAISLMGRDTVLPMRSATNTMRERDTKADGDDGLA